MRVAILPRFCLQCRQRETRGLSQVCERCAGRECYCGETLDGGGVVCRACLKLYADRRANLRAQQKAKTTHQWAMSTLRCERCSITQQQNEATRPETPFWMGLECVGSETGGSR